MKLLVILGIFVVFSGVVLAQDGEGDETTLGPEEEAPAEEAPAEEEPVAEEEPPAAEEEPPAAEEEPPAADPEEVPEATEEPLETDPPLDEDGLISLPHLPVPKYDDYGDILWFPRIIGGSDAALGEFPGKVSLQTRFGSHFCGGTLIDNRHILTAAHCVMTDRGILTPTNIEIMAGDISIRRQNAGNHRVHRIVSHIFAHPEYSAITMSNDIAILRVSIAFIIVPGVVEPQGLNTRVPMTGTTCALAGWGSTEEDSGSASPDLMRVNLEIVDTDRCNKSYQGLIGESMFCAGTMMGGRDACQGDSGGGLMCEGLVTGIVSFGFGCGRPRFPGVYIDVNDYREFIEQSMQFDGVHSAIATPTPIPDAAISTKPLHLVVLLICVALVNTFRPTHYHDSA